MLIGLDDVDWASMEQAYGSVAEVPVLLRALRSADAEDRERVFDRFHSVVHQ